MPCSRPSRTAQAEEVAQDRDHLGARPGGALAPAIVNELAQKFSADRRLEARNLQVGVVERELAENRLVVAHRLGRRSPLVLLPAVVTADLEADRSAAIALVLHGFTLDAGREGEGL